MPALPPEARTARARIGGLKRSGVPDDARRDLRAAMLADHIERLLASWPPLTSEQRSNLAELLRPVRGGGGA